MALVAREMVRYFRKDRSPARLFLEKAEAQVMEIPTLIDRVERLNVVAESWDRLREKHRARRLLENAFDLTSQMEGASADDRLRLLVQAAYKLDPKLADELTSRLDSRLPGQALSPLKLDLEVAKLRSNPGQLSQLSGLHQIRGIIQRRAARKLVQDFATGRGVISVGDMENWLDEAVTHSPRVIIDIVHWAVESLHQGGISQSVLKEMDFFASAASLTRDLAKWIARAKGQGIPEEVYSSFPGLNTRFVVFRPGDSELAERWLRDWLRENAEEHLKICDPYFGPEELRYLIDVPVDCRISIVTTNHNLESSDSSEQLKYDLLEHWSRLTSRTFPILQLLIVPKSCEDRFHDRAIVTAGGGLDIGPSLNGLGRSHQKVTILDEEDAKILEETYIDKTHGSVISGCVRRLSAETIIDG